MSILDKASLIQIPSGYKSTKLYSLKPSNGNGDFTFARASSATRVNSDGLIETAQVVSTTELVTNGDFATDSDWSKGNKWTISGGTANKATGSTSNISQVISGISGKRIQVTFTISNQSGSGGLGASANGSDYTQNSTNGTYTEYITPTSDNFYIRASYSFVCSIDNVSVKEVFENDVPRLDYSGGASCASLLLEPQRTNLLPYSSDFSQWDLVRATSTANATTSPDGTNNAYKLQSNTTGASGSWYREVISAFSGSHNYSVFAKSGTTDFMQLWIDGIGGVIYDLSDGSVKSESSGITGSVEDYGNGWYRCSLQVTASSTTTLLILVGNENMSNLNWFATSGDNIYVYGAQVEAGSFSTSLINSNGASATRTADVCNNAGTAATFNDSEGVLFAEIAALANDGTNRTMSISDGTNTNQIVIRFSSTANQITAYITDGGVITAELTHTLTNALNYNKIGLKYKLNDVGLWVNGTEVATDTSATMPSGFDELKFSRADGANDFYGKCKQLIVFNEALSDSELTTLTS